MERLQATFRPQQWVGDYAENIPGTVTFDATEKLLRLPNDEIRNFKENNYDSDNLADDLPERVAHDGPFEVDTDIDVWLYENCGVEQRQDLTDEQIDELRREFGVKAPENLDQNHDN